VSYAYGDNQPTGCNLIGRLMTVTATVSGGNNASNYLCYDWAGRPTSSSQMTAGVTHPAMSYGYDLAGELTSFTFPSGRKQTNAYDTGGRVSGVTGTYNSVPTTYGASFGYFANGALMNVSLGPIRWFSSTARTTACR
jgi:YD repeat-containing protein